MKLSLLSHIVVNVTMNMMLTENLSTMTAVKTSNDSDFSHNYRS